MRYKILLVDDDPGVSSGLKRGWQKLPFAVFCAGSVDEARRILAMESIDAVVSDEKMPGMNGTEFLASIRNQYPGMLRMMLTGQTDLETAVGAINRGAVHCFFTKPCVAMEVGMSLKHALEARDLAQGTRKLLGQFQRQSAVLEQLERANPGITQSRTDDDDAFVIDEPDTDMGSMLRLIEEAMGKGESDPRA